MKMFPFSVVTAMPAILGYWDFRGVSTHCSHMGICVPEAPAIKGRDKWLHPTVSVGCNHLSLPLISASGTHVHIKQKSCGWHTFVTFQVTCDPKLCELFATFPNSNSTRIRYFPWVKHVLKYISFVQRQHMHIFYIKWNKNHQLLWHLPDSGWCPCLGCVYIGEWKLNS